MKILGLLSRGGGELNLKTRGFPAAGGVLDSRNPAGGFRIMWGEGFVRARFRALSNNHNAMKSTTTPVFPISEASSGFLMHAHCRGNFMAFMCIALLTAGVAGGWLLRGIVSASATDGSPSQPAVATARHAPVPVHTGHLAQVWGSDSNGKPADSPPQPFDSLEEIADALGEFDIFSGDMCLVELMTALPRLIATDLPATRRILDELNTAAEPKGDEREMIAGMLLGRWMIQQPETALRYMQAHPELGGLGRDAEEFFKGMSAFGTVLVARHDPAAAHKLLAELLPEDQRKDPQKMLDMWEARSDPARVLTAMPPERVDHAADLAGVWARRDPETAALWVDSLVEGNESIVSKVAKVWVGKDQAAAIAWAAGIQSDSAREAAFSAIEATLTSGMDFAQAAEALKVMPAAAADSAILRCAANSYGKERAAELQAVGEILARYSGDQAMQEAGSCAACNLVQWVAESNGEPAAIAWMMSLPDGGARNAAVESLSAQWTDKDATAASEWVASLPPGDLRSHAIVGMLNRISGTDHERALTWAQALPPGKIRTEQIANVMRGWLPKDPYAAMRAVESLPEELRAEIWKDAE